MEVFGRAPPYKYPSSPTPQTRRDNSPPIMADDAAQSERSNSPVAWASASPALTSSSASSLSGRSSGSRLSWGAAASGVPNGRRGYMRPEGTTFADSAKNRESVMSLGTIAHLQYYFARTGLLDEKGGRHNKETKRKKSNGPTEGPNTAADRSHESFRHSFLSYSDDKRASFISSSDDAIMDEPGMVESPVAEDEDGVSWNMGPMLPPTVSTYKNKVIYVPPPPNMIVLRRELREALDDARSVLSETEKPESMEKYKRQAAESEKAAAKAAEKQQREDALGAPPTPEEAEATETSLQLVQGWHEIQGLHVLDKVTLAIRAAKNYYTAHEDPQRLYAIKSEKSIRSELYQVLEVLKRMAARDFVGGMRDNEREPVFAWITEIENMINAEQEKEIAEEQRRERWSWREGDWDGRERERELLFLKTFDEDPDNLPEWTDPGEARELPTPFLQAFQSGLRLVRLHNELVRKSRRQFEEIKIYHTDTSLPYRCAENLRYWVKAAELRWEIKLKVDVMAIVHGESDEAWRAFDMALLRWCKGVREEITMEWKKSKRQGLLRPPTLVVDSEAQEKVAAGFI
ncbi:uncharacterized protein K452DRAFT_323564 [Aplosporella prunicola CBS 121167]|uniref:Uncharacterized protein n=1 Tax=Aplosporella prunicola CBS 121167 TaxID=1176127 RepID=A0A6A6BX90_9PEZI|nr:uncharacterized protein K452DRAFT_323564 [Aplosporella prunicola CBS 121167]KAF2147464.1 hypothetical protein K452DRAFT_323564 [Aplosporella prunicola CBS 121167]